MKRYLVLNLVGGNRVFYIKIINKRARTESAAGLNDLILVVYMANTRIGKTK